MADIFLSYAREDRTSAERVAQALAGRGYDVWWDPDIPAGRSYTQAIDQALTSAKCVLVLWSATSVASSWVQDEAREGQERGVLVSARLADVKPPLGFRGHQLADLATWDGGADDREFRRLLRGIEACVSAREPSPLSQPLVRGPRQRPVSSEADVPSNAIVPPEASAAGNFAEPAKSWSASEPSVLPVSSTSQAPTLPVTPPVEAARSAVATFFGGVNGLAIAAVVVVVVVTGMIVILRDKSLGPASSSAVVPSDPTQLAAPPVTGSRLASEPTTSSRGPGTSPAPRETVPVTPADAVAFQNRAWHRQQEGDLAGAREDYDTAIRLQPDLDIAYSNRGYLRHQAGDLAGAREDYDTAIRLNPNDAHALNNRGLLRSQQGDSAGAFKDYDSVIRINPAFLDAFYNRAALRAAQGDPAGALKDYDTVIRLNPNDADAFSKRGLLRLKQGDSAGAQEDLKVARQLGQKP